MKETKKFLGIIAIAAIIGFGFAACDDEGNNDDGGNNTIPVTGVTLNKTTLALTVGGSDTLVADIAPSNATNTNVTWVSSNASVATVNNGTVTAAAAGTAAITVTTADGGKTATCAVTVTAVSTPVAVTGVTLNKTTLALTVGGSDTLVADIAPSNATNTNVTWSTSNPSVATVNNGTVTAVAAGTATITVTTADGGKTATCAVTVEDIYEIWFGGPWGPSTSPSDPFYGQKIGDWKFIVLTEAEFIAEKKIFKDPPQELTLTEFKDFLVGKGFSESRGSEVAERFVSEDYEHILLGFTTPSIDYPTEGDFWNILR